MASLVEQGQVSNRSELVARFGGGGQTFKHRIGMAIGNRWLYVGTTTCAKAPEFDGPAANEPIMRPWIMTSRLVTVDRCERQSGILCCRYVI